MCFDLMYLWLTDQEEEKKKKHSLKLSTTGQG